MYIKGTQPVRVYLNKLEERTTAVSLLYAVFFDTRDDDGNVHIFIERGKLMCRVGEDECAAMLSRKPTAKDRVVLRVIRWLDEL